MSPSAPILDYAAPHRRRVSIAEMLLYAGFLIGLLYSLYAQAGDRAPLRVQASALNTYGGIETQLRMADADPNPAEVQVYLDDPYADQVAAATRVTRVYYMAQYLRFPHRLFVGQDETIINGKEQFLDAAHLPCEEWMLQHQVTAIYRVDDLGNGPPQLEVHPIR